MLQLCSYLGGWDLNKDSAFYTHQISKYFFKFDNIKRWRGAGLTRRLLGCWWEPHGYSPLGSCLPPGEGKMKTPQMLHIYTRASTRPQKVSRVCKETHECYGNIVYNDQKILNIYWQRNAMVLSLKKKSMILNKEARHGRIWSHFKLQHSTPSSLTLLSPSHLSHSGILLDVSALHKLCLSFGLPHRSVHTTKILSVFFTKILRASPGASHTVGAQ